jgi:predicted porin
MKLNKTLLAVVLAAVAAAPVAAMADSKVYGSVRLSLVGTDDGSDMSFDIKNNASRLGFKGTEELENGLKAVAHYELGVNADVGVFATGKETNRLSYVGLEGGFGGVYLGSQWSPFYLLVGSTTDQFNAVGLSHGHTSFRKADAIGYNGTFGAVNVKAMIQSKGTDDTFADVLQIGAKFTAGPVKIGVAYEDDKSSDGDGDRLGLGVTYEAGELTLAGELTNTAGDRAALGADDTKGVELFAGYGLGNGNSIGISFGQTDNGGDSTPNSIALGYQNKMSKKTRIWVEGQLDNADADGVDDTTTIALGMRHDW